MDKKQKQTKNLYDFDYETKEDKKQKAKQKKAEKKSASKKNASNNSSKKSRQALLKEKYDDEIIIGVTKYPEKTKKEKTKNPVITTRKNNTKNKKTKSTKNNHIDNYNIQEQKQKKKNKTIKITILTVLIIAAIIFAMLSPIFNIKNITVVGNNQISKEEIISLSGIYLDENMFKISKLKIVNNIKQNAYINQVTISKKLPDTIQITVVEREPTYMLEYGNGYVYVNNQGYMLEISSIKKELPILLGIATSKEDYKEGNRLNNEDLEKLGTVIKIMNAAKNKEISNLITSIDITDENNYTLYLETEKKTVYLGDCTYL